MSFLLKNCPNCTCKILGGQIHVYVSKGYPRIEHFFWAITLYKVKNSVTNLKRNTFFSENLAPFFSFARTPAIDYFMRMVYKFEFFCLESYFFLFCKKFKLVLDIWVARRKQNKWKSNNQTKKKKFGSKCFTMFSVNTNDLIALVSLELLWFSESDGNITPILFSGKSSWKSVLKFILSLFL